MGANSFAYKEKRRSVGWSPFSVADCVAANMADKQARLAWGFKVSSSTGRLVIVVCNP
jgi:hypothetical protein